MNCGSAGIYNDIDNGQHGVTAATIDPIKESTYAFLATFIEEVASVFEDSNIHFGGDEVSKTCWSKGPTRDYAVDSHTLQTKFTKRILQIAARFNRTGVLWDECLEHGAPAETIVQVWRG